MPRTKHPCQFGLFAIATLLLLQAATTAWGQPGKQPPGAKPAPTPRAESLESLLGGPEESAPSDRLAGTPNMFGDFLPHGIGLSASDIFASANASIPVAGGCRRVKIAENNGPLPQDRVYFLYNHFENALQADASQFRVGPAMRGYAIDRYSFGFEKTFLDRRWSAELRMPLCSQMEFDTPNFGVQGGSVGNLALILKRKVYESDNTCVAIGLGVDFPTGSDARGFVNDTEFIFRNRSVHLLPYVGVVNRPGCRFFWEAFLQVDVPANGAPIDYRDSYEGDGTFGILNDQTLLYGDVAVGYWLHRNPCASFFTGVAGLLELHYTSTLQDTDSVSGFFYMPAATAFTFSNLANRVDQLNLTVGLHTEILNRTICRVGGVLPLRTGDDRAFDAEVQIQLERRF